MPTLEMRRSAGAAGRKEAAEQARAARLRLAQAERLLSDSDDAVADIMYSVGFGGLSSCYRFFKSQAGFFPAALQKGEPENDPIRFL